MPALINEYRIILLSNSALFIKMSTNHLNSVASLVLKSFVVLRALECSPALKGIFASTKNANYLVLILLYNYLF